MKVAIVGGGVAGLSALWALTEHSDNEVHIYEKADWWGGHAHTVEFQRPDKEKCDIDTAFIAINAKNYPNFHRFLLSSGVELIKTTMSFSLSRDRGAFEWASNDIRSLFCQTANIFKPRIYRMMWDIFRFHLFATDILSGDQGVHDLSIGEYLDQEGYSQAFKEDYLLPLTAGIWSIPPEKVALDFPAMALVRFFHNHQMLQLWGKPSWLTIKGGSKRYVEKIIERVRQDRRHLNIGIEKVVSQGEGWLIRDSLGREVYFDKVILATHTDQAMAILGDHITSEEKHLLGSCSWSANQAVVHWDENLMPVGKKAWTAWNYLTTTMPLSPSHEPKTTASDVSTIAITFNLNILQDLPVEKHGQILVTLNPPIQPDRSKIISRWEYHHPILTPSLQRAQRELDSIQGKRGLYFIGAWTGYGFHEDGWKAGMQLAYRPEFGVRREDRPWEVFEVDPVTLRKDGLECVFSALVSAIDWGVKETWVWLEWFMNLWIPVIGQIALKASFGKVKTA